MDIKAIEQRRAYKRDWYRRNKDKAREYQERYWNKKADAAEDAEDAEAAE